MKAITTLKRMAARRENYIEGLEQILGDLYHWDDSIFNMGRKIMHPRLATLERLVHTHYRTDSDVALAEVETLRKATFEYPKTRKNWDDAECKKYIKGLCELAIR
jgi:recombinational DNA repair ATPase RecF